MFVDDLLFQNLLVIPTRLDYYYVAAILSNLFFFIFLFGLFYFIFYFDLFMELSLIQETG